MPIGDLLRNTSTTLPDKTAMVWSNMRISYREFDRQADKLANTLTDLGFKDRAKIAILSKNRPEYAITYFAIARTPYVSVHFSTRSSVDEIAYMLDKTGTELIFIESEFLPMIDEVMQQREKPIDLVLFDEDASDDTQSFETLTSQGDDKSPVRTILDNDELAITFTGGTTGYPKAVLVSHGARYATAISALEEFDLATDDVFLASTPLFHTVGLFVWFSCAVALGATVIFLDGWAPEDFMHIVAENQVTAAFLVPSQLNDLVTDPSFSAERLDSLKNIGYAGAPMSLALFDRVQSALPNVVFTENYGQSEACPITVRRREHGREKLGSVGQVAKFSEIAIVDNNGRFLPANSEGEIVTRGPTVFSEYFGDLEETEKVFALTDGWLQTGDVGSIDNDGFLTLIDRSKDMLISGGENICPTEIENALYQHPAVKECAVFGVPDDRWGEVPVACVVLSGNVETTAEELTEFCAQKIARFKRPRRVEFLDRLPKTSIGKIRKNVLRDPYWAGRDRKI